MESGCIRPNVVLFGQSDCIRTKVVTIGKPVFFGQK